MGPERKVSLAKSESADSGVGAEPGEEEAEAERRVIRPDDTAVRRLLNFDEVIVDNIGAAQQMVVTADIHS